MLILYDIDDFMQEFEKGYRSNLIEDGKEITELQSYIFPSLIIYKLFKIQSFKLKDS